MKYFAILLVLFLASCESQLDPGVAIAPIFRARNFQFSISLVAPDSGSTLGNPVAFSWTSVPGATQYKFCWSQDKQIVVENEQPNMIVLGTSLTLGGFGRGTTHWWKVVAMDEVGNRLAVSQVWSFTAQ